MRVLIIGCGYVGLPLGVELRRLGHEVFGVRRSARGTAALQQAGLHPIVADISNPDACRQWPEPFDWIINTAACGPGGTLEDYRRLYLEGTRHLLERLQAAPPALYVYTSSTSVYAQDDGSWVDEESPAEPSSPTSRILRQTETLLLEAWRKDRFPAVILRLAGIYGPGRGYAFKQFIRGEATLSGAGRRHMNMIHRDDVVGAIQAALHRGRPGAIYNVVDDEPVSQRDFFAWVASQLGRPLPPQAPEAAETDRKRGLTDKRVSNRRLKTDLRYRLRFPTFREGYAAEIEHLRSRTRHPTG